MGIAACSTRSLSPSPLQFSPQLEEMERFAEEVIPLVNGARPAERAA